MTNEGKHYGQRPASGNRQPRSGERAGGGMKGRHPKGCRKAIVAGVLVGGLTLATSWPVALTVGAML